MIAPRSRDSDRGPLLGALLRFAHQAVVRRLVGELSRAGFRDVQAAHFAPLQALWDHPEGVRATDLAAKAKITKQSMGELIGQLVSRGYVERVPDPRDGRAHLIRMTSKGREVGLLARKTVREVEAGWSRRIGATRIEELRETLQILLRESQRR
jgi:DNA-binding MarR family transcriptional regulator